MFDLFREASQSLIAELEHLGDYQSLEAGQELIREGKIDGAIYVLKDGVLNVTTSSAAGAECLLNFFRLCCRRNELARK